MFPNFRKTMEHSGVNSRTSMVLGVLFGNVLVFPFSSSIYDEIICFVCMIFILVNGTSRQEMVQDLRKCKLRSPQFLLLSYLVSNASITFLVRKDTESLKWLLFYALLTMVYIHLQDLQLIDLNSKLLLTGFYLYTFFIIIAYYISEIIFRVPYFDNQSRVISGTTTYMMAILVLTFCINSLVKDGMIKSGIILFFLGYWAVYLSASRAGLFGFYSLLVITFFLSKVKLSKRLMLLVGFSVCLIVVPKVHGLILYETGTTIQKPPPIDVVENPLEIISTTTKNFRETIQFFGNPRYSDQDRKLHLECTFTEFKQLNWFAKIFGVGPSEHRSLIGECLSGNKSSFSRSISVARILLDTGLVGGILVMLSTLNVAVRYLKARNFFATFLIVQFSAGHYLQDQGNLILVWLGIMSVELFNREKKL